jgi:hypothetical protein
VRLDFLDQLNFFLSLEAGNFSVVKNRVENGVGPVRVGFLTLGFLLAVQNDLRTLSALAAIAHYSTNTNKNIYY